MAAVSTPCVGVVAMMLSLLLAGSVAYEIQLTTDYETHTSHPLAVSRSPVLQWSFAFSDDMFDVVQEAFRVVVSQRGAAASDLIGVHESDTVVWDSYVVQSSNQSVRVPGSLPPSQRFTWTMSAQLSYTSPDGKRHQDMVSALEPAHFDTQPDPSAWAYGWLGGHNQVRAQFNISDARSPVSFARAYVVGLGAAYLYVNGQRIGDSILDPGQTVTDQRLMYAVYDVTPNIVTGFNVIGLMLGNYKYGYLDNGCNVTAAGAGPDGCRTMAFYIKMGFANGDTRDMNSNQMLWQGRQSHIVYDHIFHGETHDARLALPGWATLPLNEFPPDVWEQAKPISPRMPYSPPEGKSDRWRISPRNFAPIRIKQNYTLQTPGVTVREAYTQCPTGFIGGWAKEASTLELKCTEGTGQITAIVLANYGQPVGNCPSFSPGSCSAPGVQAKIEALCLGKSSCSIPATNAFFGTDPCPHKTKSLAVVAQGCEQEANAFNRSFVFDFGANMAGFCTLKAELPQGTEVVLRHAETLSGLQGHANNIFYPPAEPGIDPCSMPLWYEGKWNSCANQTDVFVFNGTGPPETFTPMFTYHGFRYVEVFGIPDGKGTSDFELTAHRSYSDLPVRATFQTQGSDAVTDRIKQLHAVSHNTQLSQLWSIPTDCPQREKRGWMGDAHMTSDGLMFMHDSMNFHLSFLRSIRDEQLKGCVNNPNDTRAHACSDPAQNNGSVPDVVPFATSPYGSFPGSPVWQSAYPVIAWNLWKHFGSTYVLEELYEGLVEFMDYLERNADPQTGLVEFGGLGDWNPPGGNANQPTPTRAVSAFYYILDVKYMADIAEALGESEDAGKFKSLLVSLRDAYHKAFYNTTSKTYATGSQCSLVMALACGAVPEDLEIDIVDKLVSSINAKKLHLDLGVVGMTHIFDVLSSFGLDGLAIEILMQDTYPSFGYMLANQATTFWESWEGSAYDPVSSLNHIMFAGGFNSWLFGSWGGLRPETSGKHGGWQRIQAAYPLFADLLDPNQTLVWYTRQPTPYGNALMLWARYSSGPYLQVAFPAGTSGTLLVPIPSSDAHIYCGQQRVWENGRFVPGETGIINGTLIHVGDKAVVELDLANGSFSCIVASSTANATDAGQLLKRFDANAKKGKEWM